MSNQHNQQLQSHSETAASVSLTGLNYRPNASQPYLHCVGHYCSNFRSQHRQIASKGRLLQSISLCHLVACYADGQYGQPWRPASCRHHSYPQHHTWAVIKMLMLWPGWAGPAAAAALHCAVESADQVCSCIYGLLSYYSSMPSRLVE
jgi:hypothetical protein